MRLDRLGTAATVLLVVVAGAFLVDVWYVMDTGQVGRDVQRLEDDLAAAKRSLWGLQSTSQLASLQKELADLQAKVPAGIKQPLPREVDTFKMISSLIDGQPASARVVSFRAKEPKLETVDGVAVQSLGYEVSLQGSTQDLLTLIRRVDESNLVSLKVTSLGADRQDDNWQAKLDLTLYVLAPAQAVPTPAAGRGR